MEIFCREYTEQANRLVAEHSAGLAAARTELGRVDRDLDKLVEAILDGVPGARVKDKMAALELRKEVLQAEIAEAAEMPVRLHPSLADHYRDQIHRLRDLLQG